MTSPSGTPSVKAGSALKGPFYFLLGRVAAGSSFTVLFLFKKVFGIGMPEVSGSLYPKALSYVVLLTGYK